MFTKILILELFHSIYLIVVILGLPLAYLLFLPYKIIKVLRNCIAKTNIRGEVAVVTGCGGGLGRQISKELAIRGCHIAVVDVQENYALETAQHLAETYKVKTKAYKVDIRDYDQLLKLRESVTADLGIPTILINNAGVMLGSSIKNPAPHDIKQIIDVNFTAMCYTQQIFVPKMKELNKGHIVNIGSIAGLFPTPLLDIYSGTKAAVHSISTSLRIECILENKNIFVTTVMPTFLTTNKQAENIVNKVGMQNFFPLVDGDIMAKYIINGMLNGSREITGPYVIHYISKVLQLFPAFAYDWFIALILYSKYDSVIKSKEIENLLSKKQ